MVRLVAQPRQRNRRPAQGDKLLYKLQLCGATAAQPAFHNLSLEGATDFESHFSASSPCGIAGRSRNSYTAAPSGPPIIGPAI